MYYQLAFPNQYGKFRLGSGDYGRVSIFRCTTDLHLTFIQQSCLHSLYWDIKYISMCIIETAHLQG